MIAVALMDRRIPFLPPWVKHDCNP